MAFHFIVGLISSIIVVSVYILQLNEGFSKRSIRDQRHCFRSPGEHLELESPSILSCLTADWISSHVSFPRDNTHHNPRPLSLFSWAAVSRLHFLGKGEDTAILIMVISSHFHVNGLWSWDLNLSSTTHWLPWENDLNSKKFSFFICTMGIIIPLRGLYY